MTSISNQPSTSKLWKSTITSPVGELQVYATDSKLVGLLWPDSADRRFEGQSKPIKIDAHPLLSQLQLQLKQYFAGQRQTFDIPVAPQGTDFQRLAWQALTRIPYGQTRTYSQQATSIGRPKAVRAIGAANGQNPISIVIPCHRVVGKSGKLTGFAGGLDVKQYLLDLEQGKQSSTWR